MANSFIKPQRGLIENILWKRVTNTDEKRKSDRGAIVIDPNKIEDENGKVYDRYIKQEDLVIYAELKVYKKPEYSVIKDNEKTTILPNNDFITINMLNPLQKNATNNTKAQYKNKLTTQWSEFFTNDITNNPLDDSFIVDPETFGISSIDISIDANFLPNIKITFIDIQGRTLFERGNDENNPYNIFFTYPYPKFVLKYKGYYGKTVENQLVLIKSNYRFDPSTGNYTITCEFQSEVFSLLNSILIVYAYAAPYMFATPDGDYLGNKILKKLYENQNKALADQFGATSTKYSKLEILDAPKLTNLAKSLQTIQYDSIINNSDNLNNEEDNNNLLRIKYFIESNVELIRANFNDTTVYTKERDPNNTTYTYKLINKPDNGIFDQVTANSISDINDELKKIISLSQYNNYTNNINKFYGSVKTYQPNPDINKILTDDIFKYKNNDGVLFLDNFNNIMTLIDQLLDDILKEIEDKSYETTIKNIKDSLKYEPNLSNVVRIISNNIQTFLLLMRIVSEMAVNQIEKDGLRQLIQDKNTTVVINKNQSKIYSAFPNYYETKKRNLNGEDVEMNVQAYPGRNTATDDWFEVQFVEEFYNAIRRLHDEMGGANQNNLFGNKKTGLISVFCLGNSNFDDLGAYEDKKRADDILLELFKKYTLHLMYSGFIYRSNNLSDYATSMANYEIELINDNVIDTITSINQKYLLASVIKKYTDKNGYQNNLTSFGYSFFNIKKDDGDKYKKETINEIKLYKSKFTEDDFDKIINRKNNIITNNKFGKLYNNTSPKLYSIGLENGKENKTSVIPDLKYNSIYYSDKYPEPFNNSFSSEDTNLTQGFIKDLNKKLNVIQIDTNFTTSKVSFDNTTVNTLTFSTAADDTVLNKVESISNVFDIYKEI